MLLLLLLGATAAAASSPLSHAPRGALSLRDAARPRPPPARRRPAPSAGWSLRQALSVRGGRASDPDYDSGSDSEFDAEEEDESDSDESAEEEESEESAEEEESEESEEEEESEEKEESDIEEGEESEASSPLPVKLTVRTGLNSVLIDQRLDLTASSTRTVASLRQAVSRTMRGRPPLQTVRLRHRGRTLGEDETVADLLRDEEEDEDDDDDDDDEDGEEDAVRLALTCDAVPPVDAKFGLELRERLATASAREILAAYCANAAGAAYGQELLLRETERYARSSEGDAEEDDEEEEEEEEDHARNLRKRALVLETQFRSALAEETLRQLEEEHARVRHHQAAAAGTAGRAEAAAVYGLAAAGGGARRGARRGGATMTVKRSLQRNLNVDWADTCRNALLFLFFGYFGGRQSVSRAVLLLASPLCFLLQARPAKVFLKRLFYFVGEPPGIVLSLFPAPQQAIMALDYGRTMRGLYGEAKWEEERAEGARGKEEDEDRYDDESEYDSEDER